MSACVVIDAGAPKRWVVAVFANGFRQQADNWCGWVRNAGLTFETGFNEKGWRVYEGTDWGADVVRMDERNAAGLLALQQSQPAIYGTPWNLIDMRTGKLLT